MSEVETLAELLKLQGTCEVHQTIANVVDFGSDEACELLHLAMMRVAMRAGQVLMHVLLDDSWCYLVQARYEWRQCAPEEYVAVVTLDVADAERRPLARGTLEAVAEVVRAQMQASAPSPPAGVIPETANRGTEREPTLQEPATP